MSLPELKIKARIRYHSDCMQNCDEHVIGVQEHYEVQTRSGLDQYQLQELLVWRKEEHAKARALKDFHKSEISWLRGLMKIG